MPYLPWSNKPTQVNKATPLICWSETFSFFFFSFCHPSLDLRCFSHIVHRDGCGFRGWMMFTSWSNLQNRGNSDLLFGSVLLQHDDDDEPVFEKKHWPAGRQKRETAFKRKDILRMTTAELFCSHSGRQRSLLSEICRLWKAESDTVH